MKKFKPGQEVTLMEKVIKWYVIDTNFKADIGAMPEYGDVYTVKGYTRYTHGRGWFLTLEDIGPEGLDIELPERLFGPVMSTDRLYKELE